MAACRRWRARSRPRSTASHLYAGANDGRVLALTLASGAVAWEHYLPEGVTAIAARAGRVYAGGGDKYFYCLSGRSGKEEWQRSIGAKAAGRIAVDDERVYFSALTNVIYALDRSNGNQRWTSVARRRAITGVVIAGHIVFVPSVSAQLSMFYDRDGRPSGSIALPSEMARDVPPAVSETPAGVVVFAVTGGLANEWQLTYIAAVDEASIAPFAGMTELPGVPFLTDPILAADRPGARSADARGSGAVAGLGNGMAARAARSAARAAYDAPGAAVAAAVASASDSARRVSASRDTPASMRSGVGAENDSRSVLCPCPFT